MSVTIRHLWKTVGTIREDRVFVCFRDSKRHFFKKFGGYALSLDVLRQIKEKGNGSIIFVVNEGFGVHKKLVSCVSDFLEFGSAYTDRDGDVQRVLGLDRFMES